MSLSPSSPSSPTRTIKASQTNPLLALPTKHIAQIDPTVQLVVQALETTKNYVTEYPERIDEVWKETRKWIIDYRRRNKLKGLRNHTIEPPAAKRVKVQTKTMHGDMIDDEYDWLKDKNDPEVIGYMRQENEYANGRLNHTEPLQSLLYSEFVSHMDENVSTPATKLADGFEYYSRKEKGQEYAVHCRRSKSEAPQVWLNENELAMDSTFFHLGFIRHSPNYQTIVYGADTTGNERYTINFMILDGDAFVSSPYKIFNAYKQAEFSRCGHYLYYLEIGPGERAYRLRRWSQHKDDILYEESDDSVYLDLTKSGDGNYIFLSAVAKITTEIRYIELQSEDPTESPEATILLPKKSGVTYSADSHGAYFYVLTNEDSINNHLFRIHKKDMSSREVVVEHREYVLIEQFLVQRNHVVLMERSNAKQMIRVIHADGFYYLDIAAVSGESAGVYTLWIGGIDDEVADLTKKELWATNTFRFTYTSFTSPKKVIDFDMASMTHQLVHEEIIPGYQKHLYTSRRLHATGVDGTAIPISLVHRTASVATKTGANPLLLHAYGAYGYSTDPIFAATRLSLLDRGFIFAIAHVRGGSEMGNRWYEEGKLGKKQNTMDDFIKCAEYLIKEQWTSPGKLGLYGRSAGGLLMGAVLNMRPDLFTTGLLEVPFVDCLNTMLDASIPWTTYEYDEWGNPADINIYNTMKSYDPYTNIQPKKYPNMLVCAGLNDPKVSYVEPAKYTARLRYNKKLYADKIAAEKQRIATAENNGNNPMASDYSAEEADTMLLFKVDDVGHAGSAGQYAALESLSFEYAFLIYTLKARFKRIEQKLEVSTSLSNHVPPAYLHTGYDSLGDFGLSSDSDDSVAGLKDLSVKMNSQEMIDPDEDELSPLPSPTAEGRKVFTRARKPSVFSRLRKTSSIRLVGNAEERREKVERRGVYAWLSNRL